ncbi:MAG: GWxTD domain-containing protein [bacterium]
MKWLSIGVSFLFFSLSMVMAQQLIPRGAFVLNVDYARFQNNDSTSYLEIYLGFYPRLAAYEFRQGSYNGLLKMHTRVTRTESKTAVVNKWMNIPLTAVDTASPSFRSTYITQIGYALPFGEYQVSIVVHDSLIPSRRDSAIFLVNSQRMEMGTSISDIELCSNIKESTTNTDLFYKNALDVVPNPTLVFGVATSPVMFSYMEVYNVEPGKPYRVRTQLMADDGKIIKDLSRDRKYGARNSVEAGPINVGSVPSGRHKLILTLGDSTGKVYAQTDKKFFIYNPHIKSQQASPASIKASELAGLTTEELAAEFRRAQYVATTQDTKTFSEITSLEGRREFLANFWVAVETGRDGKPALTRSQYMQRVVAANQRFRAMSKEGWSTDRGRVFILYSEPDHIERYPSSDNNKPYETWQYYSIEGGVQFIFVDRSGFGEYLLVNSTKRGELMDQEWERFLR